MLCIINGPFKDVLVIIITYYTASRCLSSIIEFSKGALTYLAIFTMKHI